MQNITQAVILAGGEGKRLRPFTIKNPKPMIPINGKPFLEHLIKLLKDNGIEEIIILTGYFSNKIEKYFGDGSKFGLKIKYSYTPFTDKAGKENKSGLRLINASNLLDSKFLLLYCDNYWPLNLNKMTKYYNDHPVDVMVTVYCNNDKLTKNNMNIKDGHIIKYDPKREGKYLNCVDIGFFIVNKVVLKLATKKNFKFEDEILPKLIKKKSLGGYLSEQMYYSIGDLQRVKNTTKYLKPKKVIFLDRDGVINKKPKKAEYVKKWQEFKFLPGAIEAIKILTQKGYDIFVITNQAGVARKSLSFNDLQDIHKMMQKSLRNDGGRIKGIYCCLHNWDDGCNCRKPKPGLLMAASKDYFIDLTKALFIGDDKRDKQAGEAGNCPTVLVNKSKNLLKIANSLP